MKRTHLIIIVLLTILTLLQVSCNDYLDEMPDNRAELDSPSKISSFLVSGYPTNLFPIMTEYASDNMDHRTLPANLSVPYKNIEDSYLWGESIDNTGNDSPKSVWSSLYNSVAVANQALQAIADLGNPESLNPQKGEALMIRAYCHFTLVNLFCLHYNSETSDKDLGIPYMDKPETDLNPNYERGNVAEVYRKIEADILEGLPLIDDNAYTVAPKYHFNRRASDALASRFYLYYGKYDEAIKYSIDALAPTEDKILRDLTVFPTLVNDVQIYCREWCEPTRNCNFLVVSLYSAMGTCFNNYSTGKLYQHTRLLAETETVRSRGPWNQTSFVTNNWYHKSSLYSSSGYIVYPKVTYVFQYTDQIAGTGYSRSIYPVFTADEVLLNRAEAYIVKEDYDNALKDLHKWMDRHFTTEVVLTRDLVNSYYGNLAYYEPGAPTAKKAINPLNFSVVSAEQENFIQCLLHFRRIETIFTGLRWFDIKRFGIEIYRRDIDNNSSGDTFVRNTDKLTLGDPRRAIQIPGDVISAGLTANPRN